jgi:transposase
MPRQDTQARPTRRQHAATFKRELVERSLQPSASVSGIALENGINTNMLFRWRREHLRAAARAENCSAARAVLLPVEVAATTTPSAKQEAVSACSPMPAGVIEIDIGVARVRLRGSVDEANLRCVLQTLKATA